MENLLTHYTPGRRKILHTKSITPISW